MKPHFTPNAKWAIPPAIKIKIMDEFIQLKVTAKEQAEKYGYSYGAINRLHTTALENYAQEQREKNLPENKYLTRV